MSASQAQFLFQIAGINYDTRVVEFNAIEGMSCTYEVNITLACKVKINFDEVAGLEAVLTIVNGKPAPFVTKTDLTLDRNRYFHGVICKFKQAGINGDYNIYRVQIVPSLWFLSLERDCRIFQNKLLHEIVTTVLDETNIKGNRIELSLRNKEIKKEYCVQYRETDLNFISRLLEEDGIFYYFKHEKNKHVLIICDDSKHCEKIKGESEVVFGSSDGMNPNEESIAAFNSSQRIRPGAFTHTSFNYEHVSNNLKSNKKGNYFSNSEIYDYTGGFTKQENGKNLADIRLAEQKLLKQKGKGESNCPRFTPGYTYTLLDHDNVVTENEYLIVAVAHSGEQPQSLDARGGGASSYENSFICIPAKTEFRPARITPKPIITGLQSAIVTGPEGEEIHTDKYGRITVRFHWDRLGENNDKSSCSLRVAQAWGGGGWGAQFIPRIGDEVLVDFLEGDPDRPIVTGCVYNSDNMPINNLDKSKTQSGFRTKTHKGEGFNELRFDDATGAQEVYLHAEKDWNITVKNNETKSIGNNLVNNVAKTVTVNAGEQLQLICGNASIVLDQSGRIVINGTEVSVSSSGALNLVGKPVKLN